MKKRVAQLNAESIFVGITEADESPLEPGVFLLPGGCVDALPGLIPAGKRARFENGVFVIEDIPLPPPPPPPTPEELAALAAAQAKAAKRAAEAQDAREDVGVQAIAEMTPQQIVAHINSTFSGMSLEQRRLLQALAKMMRIFANEKF